MKISGSESGSGDPDPLVRGMYPWIRIWIPTKISWILNGTPTKRQVSKRQVSKRLFSKRPVSKRQVYKTSDLQNVRFQNIWFQKVRFQNVNRDRSFKTSGF